MSIQKGVVVLGATVAIMLLLATLAPRMAPPPLGSATEEPSLAPDELAPGVSLWTPLVSPDAGPNASGFCGTRDSGHTLTLVPAHVAALEAHPWVVAFKMVITASAGGGGGGGGVRIATHDPARDVYISGELHRQGTFLLSYLFTHALTRAREKAPGS